MRHILGLAAVGFLATALSACNTTAPPPTPRIPASGIPYVTAPGFRLPEGAGCAGDVARFQAVMDNDLETGHVNSAVHTQISGEIAGARSACTAGRDAEARGLIVAAKKRHGYPA